MSRASLYRLLLALSAWVVWLGGWTLCATRLSASASLAAYVLGFVPYLFIVYLVSRAEGVSEAIRARPPLLFALFIAALIVRALMIAAPPLLSDDVYRYVWDGRVALAGINPFVYAPDAMELWAVRDEAIWPLINHKHVPTIYPPVAQWCFALNAWLGGGVSALKAIFVLFEALFIGLATLAARHTRWLKRRGVLAVVVYALNPTVCVELAWSGHLDVLAYGSLVVAAMWCEGSNDNTF